MTPSSIRSTVVTERMAWIRQMEKYQQNLSRTLELIDLCFNLKQAYLRTKHPNATDSEIEELIYRGILTRKTNQWKSQKASSKP